MKLLSLAFSPFLLMDALGNIPLFIAFLKTVNPQRQRWIICREMTIALIVIVLFSFLGNQLMDFLRVTQDTIQIAGGIILFLISLKMIFPQSDPKEKHSLESEPFIVPLAIPLVAGPSVLAAVMIYSSEEGDPFIMMGAILIAWAASLSILLTSSYLKKALGWKGIMAIERLMGLILALIAIQMLLTGLKIFLKHCSV